MTLMKLEREQTQTTEVRNIISGERVEIPGWSHLSLTDKVFAVAKYEDVPQVCISMVGENDFLISMADHQTGLFPDDSDKWDNHCHICSDRIEADDHTTRRCAQATEKLPLLCDTAVCRFCELLVCERCCVCVEPQQSVADKEAETIHAIANVQHFSPCQYDGAPFWVSGRQIRPGSILLRHGDQVRGMQTGTFSAARSGANGIIDAIQVVDGDYECQIETLGGPSWSTNREDITKVIVHVRTVQKGVAAETDHIVIPRPPGVPLCPPDEVRCCLPCCLEGGGETTERKVRRLRLIHIGKDGQPILLEGDEELILLETDDETGEAYQQVPYVDAPEALGFRDHHVVL